MDLVGQTVVIFGGSSGMGLAIARLARERGAKVTIASRSRAKLDRAIQQIGEARAIVADITDESDVSEVFEDLNHSFSRCCWELLYGLALQVVAKKGHHFIGHAGRVVCEGPVPAIFEDDDFGAGKGLALQRCVPDRDVGIACTPDHQCRPINGTQGGGQCRT